MINLKMIIPESLGPAILYGLVLINWLMPVLPASAQSEQSQAMLEEIVVTARKREESIQDTPLSISAYSSNDLHALQVDNLSQISDATPGLMFDKGAAISGSPVASSIFIRGIGQTDFTLVTDPGVGVYLDGVYIARSVGGVLDALDFEQVEVLRGPQGTLFGKNTIGGAIDIKSRLPDEEFGGHIEVKTGTDDRIDVKGTVNLPVSEWLRGRISFADLNQDGYVTNLNTDQDLSDTNATSVRFMFLAEPTDRLTMQLSGDYTNRDEQSQSSRLIAYNPGSGVPAFAIVPPAFACNGTYLTVSALNCTTPYVTSSAEDLSSDMEMWGIALTAKYDFESFSIKSITGYRKFDTRFARDADNSPSIIITTFDDMDHEQVSQEFQFSGTSLDNKLDWLLGLYYFQEDGYNRNVVPLSVFTVDSGGRVDNDQIAIFGQATYEFIDNWKLTFGTRYTEETKRFEPYPQAIVYNGFTSVALANSNGELTLGGPVPLPDAYGNPLRDGGPLLPNRGEAFSEKFDDISIMATLDYQVTDNLLVYVSYSEGFKSGGFSQRVFPALPAPIPFGPEEVSVVEGGWKLSGLDNRLRLNGSVFYSEYDDIQVTAIVGVGPSTANAANGEVLGFEAELSTLPFDNFRIDANVSYMDAEFTQVDANAVAAGVIAEDSIFVNTPEWSWFVSPSYTIPVGFGDLTFRGDFSWRDEVYNNALNSETIKQDELYLVNASLNFVSADKKWTATFSGRNLTDEVYIITGNDELGSLGYSEAVFSRDREWAFSLRYKF